MGGLPKIVNKKVIYLEVGAIFFFLSMRMKVDIMIQENVLMTH